MTRTFQPTSPPWFSVRWQPPTKAAVGVCLFMPQPGGFGADVVRQVIVGNGPHLIEDPEPGAAALDPENAHRAGPSATSRRCCTVAASPWWCDGRCSQVAGTALKGFGVSQTTALLAVVEQRRVAPGVVRLACCRTSRIAKVCWSSLRKESPLAPSRTVSYGPNFVASDHLENWRFSLQSATMLQQSRQNAKKLNLINVKHRS